MVFEAGYLGDVGLRGQSDHDVQLLQLDINGVVVLHKEHFDLLLQDLGSDEREQNEFFAKGVQIVCYSTELVSGSTALLNLIQIF